jgi:transposase InsO family protein
MKCIVLFFVELLSATAFAQSASEAPIVVKDISLSRYRVRQFMRLNQIPPVWKRKFIHTTHSKHGLPVARNALGRPFQPDALVGWAMAPHMEAELVCSALRMAIAQRQPPEKMMVHSDRGSQYASELHRALLARHGLQANMSRKGNCWDTQSKIRAGRWTDLTRVGIG